MHIKIFVTCLSLLTATQLFSMDDANLTTENLLEMDFEQLLDVEVSEVYGASKVQQKTTQAPSSVSIISAKDIKKFGYKTVGDAVASQSGFYTYYDRNYQYLGVRGFGRAGDYNTRILLMVDGQRMNDNIYDAASVGTDFPVDLALVEHIEVIRGPGSSLYGTSAFFAVINVITKDTKEFENGMLSAQLGSFSTDKESFVLSRTFDNGTNLLVSASRYHSVGQDLYFKEFDAPETNSGKTKGLDADSYENLFIKGSFGDFKVQALLNKREKSLPTAAWGMEFNDPQALTIDEHGYLGIKHDKHLNDTWQVSSQIAYNHYHYEGRYPYEEEGEIVVYKDDTPGSWIDGNIDVKYTPDENNQWLFGTYYYKNIEQNMKYFYGDNEIINKVDITTDSYAFYLQNIYKYTDKLTFTSGLRYDDYETFGTTLNPRLAAIYQLHPLTSLKLLYGQAFRAPNIYERLYADGGDSQKENPDLNPETIQTYEIVLEHYFKNSDSLTLSGFYYKIDDLITQVEDTDELLIYQNVDKVKSKGLELAYKKSFKNGLKTGVNYTYQYSIDSKTNQTLSNSPRHIGNLMASMPLFDEKYNLATTLQYSASRKNPEGEKLDDFVVANVTITGDDIIKGVDISASIYNLFDTEYASSPGEEHEMREIMQDGISASLRATYRF